MSEIMVFNEKHADRYFVVENKEDRAKVALKTLRERANQGYWYPTIESLNQDREDAIETVKNKYDQNLIILTEDEIESLPESLHIMAEQEQSRYAASLQRAESAYKNDLKWVEDLNRLLDAEPEDAIAMEYKTPRGRVANLAIYLLDSRADYKYEGYTNEYAENY